MEPELKSKSHSSQTLARGLSYAMKQCKVEEDTQAKIAVPWIMIGMYLCFCKLFIPKITSCYIYMLYVGQPI